MHLRSLFKRKILHKNLNLLFKTDRIWNLNKNKMKIFWEIKITYSEAWKVVNHNKFKDRNSTLDWYTF